MQLITERTKHCVDIGCRLCVALFAGFGSAALLGMMLFLYLMLSGYLNASASPSPVFYWLPLLLGVVVTLNLGSRWCKELHHD